MTRGHAQPDGRGVANSRTARGGVALFFLAPALVVLAPLLAYPIARLDLAVAHRCERSPAGELDDAVRRARQLPSRSARRRGGRATRSLNTLYFTVVEVAGVVTLGPAGGAAAQPPDGALERLSRAAARALGDRAGRQRGAVEVDLPCQLRRAERAPACSSASSTATSPGSATRFGALNMILHRRRLEIDALHRAPAAGGACRTSRRSLYRAARIDGANRWQSFRYVTLPSLRRRIAIAVVLQTIWSLRVFDLIFVLTKGGPADATVLLNFLAYRVTFNFLDSAMARPSPTSSSSPAFVLAIVYVRLLKPGGAAMSRALAAPLRQDRVVRWRLSSSSSGRRRRSCG